MIPYRVLLFLLLGLAVGCTVKENRTECPGILMLDFTGVDTAQVGRINIRAVSSEGIVFTDVLQSDMFSRTYVREVPHIEMKVTVWGSEVENDALLIPYGCECPPLYMQTFDADVSGELCFRKVELKKNHCRLTVMFDGEQEIPYSLTFRGNVDGYDREGLPSRGEFACVAYPLEYGGSQVIIPRQTDASLLLDVEDTNVSVLKTFAIGEYLQAGGYDWNADNLEDATVILDYYLTGIRITYKGWDKEYNYDIIL